MSIVGHFYIRINEPPNFRVIVPAVKVIKARLDIVVIPTITNGVHVRNGAGFADDLAIRIVHIAADDIVCTVANFDYVALEIRYIIVFPPVVVAERIANRVVGDGTSVIGGQQIQPCGIAIDVRLSRRSAAADAFVIFRRRLKITTT